MSAVNIIRCYDCFPGSSKRGWEPLPSILLPRPSSLGSTLGSPLSSCELPKQVLRSSCAAAQEAGTEQGGNRRRGTEASPRRRQQMGTIWAGGSGRAGSCWSGGPGSPPHPAPGMCPGLASGPLGRQEGVGSPGWALGLGRQLLLWALLLRAPSPNREAGKRSPSHCQAAVLGPTLQPLCWDHSSPRALHWLCPPVAWHTLTQISLWPNHRVPAYASPHPPCP